MRIWGTFWQNVVHRPSMRSYVCHIKLSCSEEIFDCNVCGSTVTFGGSTPNVSIAITYFYNWWVAIGFQEWSKYGVGNKFQCSHCSKISRILHVLGSTSILWAYATIFDKAVYMQSLPYQATIAGIMISYIRYFSTLVNSVQRWLDIETLYNKNNNAIFTKHIKLALFSPIVSQCHIVTALFGVSPSALVIGTQSLLISLPYTRVMLAIHYRARHFFCF